MGHRGSASFLAPAATFEEQCQALNAFKDREIFFIDLDHILNPGSDITVLAVEPHPEDRKHGAYQRLKFSKFPGAKSKSSEQD